ncbi:DRTGG domain-containing protein [Caloranaerobacter azorensis]|uniref:DRTGG domain-containing protein n=2 Tax=Caloranaerobacter azorensis TaxID=116090 RepID=A0A096BK11_9FIRM|nr:DRTGG domain-containing protein [Caloranaerobacter azorensis]KGG81197.1 hypothetical protein Y919_02090 [Caloranaerobacter azorensis H53214]QIB26611.1 hypothetical protein G3A45_04390 [Caloranaerobacter azorensis]
MKLKEIKEILNAKVLTGEEYLDREVLSAFGSDLMSDVLAFIDDGSVLLTGLTNPQVIRTAEMIDLHAIVFVRGKKPSKEIIEMAKLHNITILLTDYTLYTACGKLYEKGLKGISVEGVTK